MSWSWGLPAPGRVTGQFAPFQTDITHAIQASDLRAGDAVNNSEHVMLFKAWVTPGKTATFIEEPGCSVSQPYAREWTSNVSISGTSIHVDYNGMTFTAIRYNSLLPPNSAPKGYLDGAACTALTGWAQDPDAPNAALKVKLDFDAAEGKSGSSGSLTLTADVHRNDLCAVIGSCNHGFSTAVPLGLRDGREHTVYAYGADSSGNALTLLTGAPKKFTCAPPAIPIAPAQGIKRWVPSQKVLTAWGMAELNDVAREPAATVAAYPKGPDMPAAPTVVIADDGSPEVWVIDGSVRRHVVDPASMKSWGFAATKWPAAKVQALPQGIDWPNAPFAFMADGAPEVYVLDAAVPVSSPTGNSHEPPAAGGGAGAGADPGASASDGAGGGCAMGGARANAMTAMLVGLAIVLASRRRKDCAR